jgi:hypothetical protein
VGVGVGAATVAGMGVATRITTGISANAG